MSSLSPDLPRPVEEAGWEITTVISGCARGADTFGEQYAEEHGIPIEKHPADWERFGRSAGPRRNHEMALCAEALIAVLYPGMRGTENMIQEAKAAGLKIYVKWFELSENTEGSKLSPKDASDKSRFE